MSDFIPLSEPFLGGNEWKYVKECLDTGWVSSAGKFVDAFENSLATYSGSKFAVACVNGTAALHTALLVAGVRPNDEVLAPTLTFIAPINAIRYAQAEPVFFDCDEFYCLNSRDVLEFLKTQSEFRGGQTYNRKSARRISAVVVVHVFGNAANLDELIPFCRDRNIRVIEDATESLGSRYTSGAFAGRHTGTVGDIGCFSFNGNKIITTGGGGMLVTDNASYAEKARYLTTQAKDDAIFYVHDEVGYNYRLTNVQAAIGLAQMEQLDGFIVKKRGFFENYKRGLAGAKNLEVADVPGYAFNNCWLAAVRFAKGESERNRVMKHMAEKRIQARPIWALNHKQKPYASQVSYNIRKADELVGQTLNIPSGAGLSDSQVQRVIAELQR